MKLINRKLSVGGQRRGEEKREVTERRGGAVVRGKGCDIYSMYSISSNATN